MSRETLIAAGLALMLFAVLVLYVGPCSVRRVHYLPSPGPCPGESAAGTGDPHEYATVPIFYGYGGGWEETLEGSAVLGGCFPDAYGEQALVCVKHRVWRGLQTWGWQPVDENFGMRDKWFRLPGGGWERIPEAPVPDQNRPRNG